MDTGLALLLAHAAVTWALVGLIWTVQVSSYPLLAALPSGSFVEHHARYMRAISIVVGPLMLAEVATALALFLAPPAGTSPLTWDVGIVLVALLWLLTGFAAVPLHRRLEKGFDAVAHRRLLRVNAARAVLWTARGALLVYALAALLGGAA